MASKYTHRLLFYESWLADLEEPTKEFSPEEKWQVVAAIFQSQIKGEVNPVEDLPLSIRRALSIPTLTEQLRTILDKQQGASDRAQQAVAAKKALQEQRARNQRAREEEESAAIKRREEEERAAKQRAYEEECRSALGEELFNALRRDFQGREFLMAVWNLAVAGHERCRQWMPNWDNITRYAIVDISKYLKL